VIPGNDDAIRSCSLVIRAIADAIDAGKAKVTPAEMAAPAEPTDRDQEEPKAPSAQESMSDAARKAPEAPTAEEVAEDPAYEQVGADESAGDEVPTGVVASPPVPSEASTERPE
jgi:small subunit ribosomal protein S2